MIFFLQILVHYTVTAMDTLPEVADSLSATTSEPILANNDQLFLFCFITSIYFGPDLKEERPPRSILQRMVERLATYNLDQLGGSHMKIEEVERVFSHVLQKVEKSLRLNLPLLHQFFDGSLPACGNDSNFTYPQFPDFFPLHLHPHSLFKNKYKIIENIIFINDPDTSYIDSKDVDRFKRLTGLDNLLLDRDVARCLIEEVSPRMIFLPSCLKKEEWSNLMAINKSGIALTGSAAMGKVGNIVGRVDIGESDESYMFRVSLPGVKRDEGKLKAYTLLYSFVLLMVL